MRRRQFIQQSSLASLALGVGDWLTKGKTHALTLSFDDGFKKSFYRIAEIHEEYGISACLNVIATGHFPDFKAIDKWILPELMGDFDDWNALKSKGHEIMPHSWKHLNLAKISEKKAKRNIDKCLDYFEKHLDGYSNKEAIYNYAFLSSTSSLDAYLLDRVRAVRTGAWLKLKDTKVNLIPTTSTPVVLGAWTNGPGNNDQYLNDEVDKFLSSDGGWLVINLHGLDDEGWGPISTSCLDTLLKRLVEIDYLEVLPAGHLLNRF